MLTLSTFRVAIISSNTLRTSAEAFSYSISLTGHISYPRRADSPFNRRDGTNNRNHECRRTETKNPVRRKPTPEGNAHCGSPNAAHSCETEEETSARSNE